MKFTTAKKNALAAKALCILLITFLFTGCQLYKKQVVLNPEANGLFKSQYLNSLISQHYYIILHHGDDALHLTNLKPDSTILNWSAEVETADPAYIAFYKKIKLKGLTTYHKNEKLYLHQANLFLADSAMVFSGGKVNFDITSAKIEILQTKHFTGIFVGLGAIVGLTLLAAILVASSFDFSGGIGI